MKLPRGTAKPHLPILISILLTACGGGGKGSNAAGGPTTGEPPTSNATVARVEITQAGAMLQPSASATLSARALDADGNPLNVPVTWHTSRTTVSVDSTGLVTAGQSIGSTLITASAGTVTSQPVVVIVAQPVAGARLVADAEVVSELQPTDSSQTGRVGSQFRATLTGDAPSIGQVLLASGSKGVSGKVVSVTPAANGQEVIFEVVGLGSLFRELKIDESFDTRTLAALFPNGAPIATRTDNDGAIEQDFKIQIPAGTHTAAIANRKNIQAATVTSRLSPRALKHEFDLGPLECETDVTALAIDASELSATVINSLSVHAQIEVAGGVVNTMRLETSGALGVQVTGPIELRGQFGGELECKLEFVSLLIPVPPPVAAVVTPTVPIGAKFELSGAIQATGFSLDLTTSVSQPVAIGVELRSDGTVNNLSTLATAQDLQLDFNWNPRPDTASLTDYRVTAKIAAGGYGELAVTNPLVLLAHRLFNIDKDLALLELFAGVEAEAQWAPTQIQLANPSDPSRYELSAKASLGFSDDIFNIAKYFGIDVATQPPAIEFVGSIGATPTGLAHSSLINFQQGDAITFRVDLEPESVSLTIGARAFYNVDRVQIWRRENDGTATLVAEQEAGETQVHFMIPWTADRADATNARYYALAIPRRFGFAPLLVSETVGWRGARQSGGTGADGYGGMAIDADRGLVYTVGWTPDQVARPDGTLLPKPGGLDVIVNEWNADGSLSRALMFGSSGDEMPTMAKLGPDGALYVVGNSSGGAAITNAGPLNAMSAFIAKIDLRSNPDALSLVWARQFSADYEIASGLDFGHEGEIYLATTAATTGAFGGTVLSQNCNDVEASGNTDCGNVMLTRLDTNGTVAWRTPSPLPGWQYAPRVTVGAGSDVWVTALSWCTLDGTSSTICTANTDHLSDGSNVDRQMTGVWRYDTAGNVTPVNTIKVDDSISGKRDIALSATAWTADGLTLAGLTTAALDGHANNGGSDVVVTQIDAFGNRRWSQLYGTSASEVAVNNNLIAIPGGGFYLAFGVRSALYPPGYGGGIDGVLMRLNSNGTSKWGAQFGGSGDDRPMQLAIDDDGGVFVSGTTTGAIAPGGASSGGGTDMFILKYSSSALPQSAAVGASAR